MASVVTSRTAQAGGKTFTNGATTEVDGTVLRDPTLTAAKTGTLSTRTSDTAGTLTMASGHGITDADLIDIYWSTGQCTSALVGTVSGTSVPFTLATGAALPLADTAITAMVQHVENFSVALSDLQNLCVGAANAACSATFRDGSGVVGVVRVRPGTTTNKHYIWDIGDGSDAALTDDSLTVAVTHGDSASSRQVNVVAMVD